MSLLIKMPYLKWTHKDFEAIKNLLLSFFTVQVPRSFFATDAWLDFFICLHTFSRKKACMLDMTSHIAGELVAPNHLIRSTIYNKYTQISPVWIFNPLQLITIPTSEKVMLVLLTYDETFGFVLEKTLLKVTKCPLSTTDPTWLITAIRWYSEFLNRRRLHSLSGSCLKILCALYSWSCGLLSYRRFNNPKLILSGNATNSVRLSIP